MPVTIAPAVHENVICFNAKGQSPFYHTLKMLGGLGYCLQTSFIATGSFIQSLFDTLYPLFCFYRRTENEIQGQKTCPIRPSKCQQLEAPQACSTVMVKNPGKKFNDLVRLFCVQPMAGVVHADDMGIGEVPGDLRFILGVDIVRKVTF